MKLKCLLLCAVLSTGFFAQAQGPIRLLGLTHTTFRDSVWVPTDSTMLSYSAGRSSDVKIEDQFYWYLLSTPTGTAGFYNFDQATTLSYIDSTGSYMDQSRHDQVFDSMNAFRLMSDTYSTLDSALNWQSISMVTLGYDSATGKMNSQTSMLRQGNSWINDRNYAYNYDPSGNINSTTTSTWSGIAWINDMRAWYYYDPNHNLTNVILQQWDGSTWQNMENHILYRTGDKLDSMYRQEMVNPNWVTIDKHYYTSNADNNILTDTYYLNDVLDSKDIYTYDSMSHLRITLVHMVYDTTLGMLVNNKMHTWEYNANNQPTMHTTMSWDFSKWYFQTGVDMQDRMYYNDPTGIKTIAKNAVTDMILYPVPAQNTLNISANWSTPQAFNVSVIDMQGRVVRTWHEAATAKYAASISVADFTPGNYFIRITNATTNAASQFTVMH